MITLYNSVKLKSISKHATCQAKCWDLRLERAQAPSNWADNKTNIVFYQATQIFVGENLSRSAVYKKKHSTTMVRVTMIRFFSLFFDV